MVRPTWTVVNDSFMKRSDAVNIKGRGIIDLVSQARIYGLRYMIPERPSPSSRYRLACVLAGKRDVHIASPQDRFQGSKVDVRCSRPPIVQNNA